MNVSSSLRLYVFASMVLLSSIMAIGFSLLSGNYFIDGLDKGLKEIMFELSQTTQVEDGQPKDIVGFNIASRWQDLPDVIQQRFAPPSDTGILHKAKEQHSIFEMPSNLFFVVYYNNPEGKPRYVSRILLEQRTANTAETPQVQRQLLWIVVTGVAAITLFVFSLFVIMKKIAKPIESLGAWAKSLNHSNLQQSPPDFTYKELNALAALMRASLISTHDSLEREQQFLSYASHELRTPISVIRSNVELLNRLSERSPLNEKQALTLGRIERAGLTMSDLTNTLLWLSRNDSQYSEPEQLNLHEKISSLSEELKYLLNGKQVKVQLNTENQTAIVNTEVTACHIVLANLIRNAYQHTQNGLVDITQRGSKVTIVNSSPEAKAADDSGHSNEGTTNGYGLGLQLSEKIIKRQQWSYEIHDKPGRYEVSVDFCSVMAPLS